MRHRIIPTLLAISAAGVALAGDLTRSPSRPGAAAYIISPTDGAAVPETFTVRFGLKGMGVAPAGLEHDFTGHHHLLVDVETLPPLDRPLPMSDQVRHFGGGQTETELTLAPGEHTLQLLLADHRHLPHDPPVMSERITVFVE